MKISRDRIRSLIFSAGIANPLLLAQTKVAASPQVIPFVGCKSDGQAGPLKAPKGATKMMSLPPDIARELAYYKAEEGVGVLAPRGWYCFATYGSNGGNLYVAPEPIDQNLVFTDKWKGFAGSAVQLAVEVGGTSGRFGVAEVIARVFPAHMSFVRDVVKEGIEPASSFPVGAYPKDDLTYKSDEIVEYQTPANAEGLGTQSWLRKNDQPISGVAILVGEETNLFQLSARLPPNLTSALPAIIRRVELDAKRSEQ